jgi:Zn-dependent protease with chaperone function
MNKITKQSTVLLLIITLVFIPFGTSALAQGQALDEENSGALMTADLLLARPLGIVATVLGCAVFIVSLPFSAIGGNTKQASQKLVKEPAAFTFTRPLGEF